MRLPVKMVLISVALLGGSLSAGQPAMAQGVSVGVDLGGIAFGFRDGYWDRGHHWHHWRNHHEAAMWRAENREHYYAWRHDRDRSMGWREERWWERH